MHKQLVNKAISSQYSPPLQNNIGKKAKLEEMAIDENDEDDIGMDIDESYSIKVSYTFFVTTCNIFLYISLSAYFSAYILVH